MEIKTTKEIINEFTDMTKDLGNKFDVPPRFLLDWDGDDILEVLMTTHHIRQEAETTDDVLNDLCVVLNKLEKDLRE
jgi:hypothetical protein